MSDDDEGGMPDTRFGTQACKDELESHGISLKPPAFTGSATDICENCHYAKGVERQAFRNDVAIGDPYTSWSCHLKPPDKHDSRSEWPLVHPDSFCGEFMAKPVEEGK